MYGKPEFNEEGKIKCELCQGYYHKLGNHLYKTHKVNTQDYKAEFGFYKHTGLLSKSSEKRALELAEAHIEIFTAAVEGKAVKFKKGWSGRTRDLMREQTRLMLIENNISQTPRSENGKKLARTGLGVYALKRKYYLRTGKTPKGVNNRPNFFTRELHKGMKTVTGWCRKTYPYVYTEDVAGEVMLIGLENFFKYERGTNIATWLITIAKNLIYNLIKKDKLKENYVQYAKAHTEEAYEPYIDPYQDTRITKAIATLTPRQQAILEDIRKATPNPEMCIKYNLPPGQMKNQIYLVRKQLKSLLLT
jgi:RNA polymerase sigma factor (sigma-70 family)